MSDPIDLDALLSLCERAKKGDIRQLFYHPTDGLLITRAIEAIPALVARVRELEKAVAAERDACAKVAEGFIDFDPKAFDGGHFGSLHDGIREHAMDIAAAIRARKP